MIGIGWGISLLLIHLEVQAIFRRCKYIVIALTFSVVVTFFKLKVQKVGYQNIFSEFSITPSNENAEKTFFYKHKTHLLC